MLQTWKIKRELCRLKMKVLDVPERMSARRRQAHYDRTVSLNITEGSCSQLEDTAILLLYPVDGVAPSTLEALDHLRAHDVAPVVVSNRPLSPADKDALAERSHLLIERPNRGYDFGGYRDGILQIIERGAPLRNLFVINDSIWLPLSAQCTLIEDARNNSADLLGIHFNERDGAPSRSHLQSYFYRFGPRLTKSEDFAKFWRDLIVYDSKDLTVRRCEMILTNWFASRNYKIDHLYDKKDLFEAIANLNKPDRIRLIEYLVAIGDKHANYVLRRQRAGDYISDKAWRDDAYKGKLGRFVLLSHPEVLLEHLRFPVLKKDRQNIYRTQRAIAADDRYSHHFSKTVREELRERT